MSSFGYVVETATDGRDALDAVQRGRFDGMLLDMLMPGIGGLEVRRRTRGGHPGPPAGGGTAPAGQPKAAQGVAEGAGGCLPQPGDASQRHEGVAPSRGA